MDKDLKALIAKCWKNETLDLEPGRHDFDEVITIRVSGTVVKQNNTLALPTTSLPLIAIIALFWEKSGICRDHALRMLKEAVTEAMQSGETKDEHIEARMNDVQKSLDAVKKGLIAKLPKQRRAGRVITKDLEIEVLPAAETEETLTVAVA